MAIELSVKATSLVKETGIQPQIILDIEGVDLIFGARPILKTLKWDDESSEALWDNELTWDGSIKDIFSRDYVSLDGTTTNISQQIAPDKGSTSSISTVNISIVDKDGEVSKALSFDSITEILGRKATFAIGFAQGVYPEDTNAIFRGIVVDYYTEAGAVVISIASPENMKRQVFLEKFQTEMTSRLKTGELEVADLRYNQRASVDGTLSIQYINGASLSVAYDNTIKKITVTIVSGTTKASAIRAIIQDTQATLDVVSCSLIGDGNNAQLVFPLTVFETDTVLNLESTAGIYESQDSLVTYVKIEDELMRVVSVDSETQLTVERGQLDTYSISHQTETEAETFYRLQGKPLELALKVMLSSDGNEYFTSLDIPKSIGFVSLISSIPNSLIFDYYSIQEKTGLTVGDSIKLDSILNSSVYTIDSFGLLENGGSYITVNENLSNEIEYSGAFKYKSKYNTLSTGLGMLTNEVDVAQFELIETQFGSSFVNYDIYIKDTIDDAKEFIDRQIYFPQGLYSIPRKARSSVKFIAPPFSSDIVPTLNTDSILNASRVKQRRSVHKYLYNTYVYRYNVDSIEDKYLSGKIIISADSLNRIPVGKKQLKIESDGLRNTPETTSMINNIGQRLVDRYQYAPVYFDDIEVNYKTGYRIEVGDIVPFGGPDLKTINFQTGERGSDLALYEVINKSLNVKNGKISLSLASTSFEIFARYAVIGLSSNIGAGSTLRRIKINKTLDTDEYFKESDKWTRYGKQFVTVRSKDYSFDEEAELVGVDPFDSSYLLLRTDLSAAPLEGYIIEPSEYNDSSSKINNVFKVEFAHFNAAAKVTAVIDSSSFEVDRPLDLVVGSRICINNPAFTRDTFGEKVIIDSISGSLITLDKPLGFIPQLGDLINSSNYLDGGYPYTLI
jgi:hypothetical protein